MQNLLTRETMLSEMMLLKNILDESVQQTHPLIQNFFNESIIASKTKLYDYIYNLITTNSTVDIDNIKCDKVPKIFHRIWLTDLDNPSDLGKDFLKIVIETAKEYAKIGWVTYFWVRDYDKQISLIDDLSECGCIQVRSCQELDGIRGYDIFLKFLNHNKFAFSADVLRMLILEKHGGVYCDVGITFKLNITPIIDSFEYAFIFWKNYFFQNSLIAMPPNSSLAKIYFNFLKNPELIPKCLYSPLTAVSEGFLLSGPFLTYLYFNFIPRDVPLYLFAPNGALVSWRSQQTWYKKDGDNTIFNNCYIPDAQPTLLY